MNDDKPIEQQTDDAILQEWKLWKDRTAFAQAKERALRSLIISRHFPAPEEGSNNVELELGPERTCKLTLKYPIERKVDEGTLDALIKAAHADPIPDMPVHPLADVNFDKLIRRKPELAVKEYRGLPEDKRCLFDTCLIIKPGSAQLEMKVLEL